MTNKQRLKNIVKAINSGRFKLVEREKDWYCYKVRVEEWIWERNNIDGWGIDVYYNGSHIGSIEVDENLGKTTIKVNQ